MNTKQTIAVNIIEFPATKIAVLEHRGDPASLGESINTFIRWRQSISSDFQSRDIYNLIYNDPETTKPDEFRLDIGMMVNQDVMPNPYGIITKIIAAGRYAVVRHIGPDAYLNKALDYLYNQWLPESEERLRDVPCFFHRLNICPELIEDEQIIDIYLPLK